MWLTIHAHTMGLHSQMRAIAFWCRLSALGAALGHELGTPAAAPSRAQLLRGALACRFGIGCVSITELGKDCRTPVILRAVPPLVSAQHSAASATLRRAFQVYFSHPCVSSNQLEWQAPVDTKYEAPVDWAHMLSIQKGCHKPVFGL